MAALRFCEICKAEIEAERAEHAPDTRLCGGVSTTRRRNLEAIEMLKHEYGNW